VLPTTSGRPDLPNTLGAGGGTIAAYNRHFNAVQIRPESAGSDRGPACYDRGGLRPTVTDADLVLGYLDPDNYADGHSKRDKKRSVFAIDEDLSDELGLSTIAAAKVIESTVEEQVAVGIRAWSRRHDAAALTSAARASCSTRRSSAACTTNTRR